MNEGSGRPAADAAQRTDQLFLGPAHRRTFFQGHSLLSSKIQRKECFIAIVQLSNRIHQVTIGFSVSKYSFTISGLKASAWFHSSLSVVWRDNFGCRFPKFTHQCSLGPYSELNHSAFPERLAIAQVNAFVIVCVSGNPCCAM